jgi:hypothetical protein
MATKNASQTFAVGDRVKILHSSNLRGRIVELRGPLGAGGIQVYRVRIAGEPKPTYIELGENQIIAMPTPPILKPARIGATSGARPNSQGDKRKKERERK